MKRWILLLAVLLAGMPVSAALRADINGDGRVDLLDLAILTSEWMQEDDMSYPNKIRVSGDITPAALKDIVLTKLAAEINGYPTWGYNADENDGSSLAYPYAGFGRSGDGYFVLFYEAEANQVSSWYYESEVLTIPMTLVPLTEGENEPFATGTATVEEYDVAAGGMAGVRTALGGGSALGGRSALGN